MPLKYISHLPFSNLKNKKFLYLISICLLIQGNIFAQLFSNRTNTSGNLSTQKIISDSTHKKQLKTDDRISIYAYSIADTSRKTLDTSISFFHRNHLQNIWMSDLGNTASSAKSLLFLPNLNPQIQLGINSVSHLLFEWDQARFYNTTRAYSDINYLMGPKKEQYLSLLFTQNIKPNWNMAVNYRKINAPGFYKLQRTNHDNFAYTTQYLSKNLRYDLKAGFFYNKLQQDENGGILSTDYLYYSSYNDKRLIPVLFQPVGTNSSSVKNYLRTTSLQLQHQYFFGKSDSLINADSSAKYYSFKPIFGLKHRLYYEFEYYNYKDVIPDTSDYSKVFKNDFILSDSLYSKNKLRRFGNSFSLLSDIHFHEKTMQAEAGYGLELEKYRTLFYQSTPLDYTNIHSLNSYLFAKISKPQHSNKEWIYQAFLQFYFTGKAKGNTLLNIHFGRILSDKLGTFQIGLNQSVQAQPYLFDLYGTNYFMVGGSSPRQTITDFNAQYQNPQWLTNIQFHYYLIGNYHYRDTNLNATWYQGVIPILQVQFNKSFKLGKFIIDNQLLLQQIQKQVNSPIHIPNFATRNRLAYEDKIIKKKLSIATGFDIRYNTPYYADRYIPMFYSFVPQNENSISNIPQVAYFFNFKIKRFRASLALDELQQFFTRNNINYQNYPAPNFGLRFGVNWAFVN